MMVGINLSSPNLTANCLQALQTFQEKLSTYSEHLLSDLFVCEKPLNEIISDDHFVIATLIMFLTPCRQY